MCFKGLSRSSFFESYLGRAEQVAFIETETSALDRPQPPALQTWPRLTRRKRPAAYR